MFTSRWLSINQQTIIYSEGLSLNLTVNRVQFYLQAKVKLKNENKINHAQVKNIFY